MLKFLSEVEHNPDCVVTVGTFDGVHEGHKSLIRILVDKAKEVNGRAVLVTFDPHPREIITPGKSGVRLLTTIQERAAILGELGVDMMVVIPFSRDFSLLSSEAFIRDIVFAKIGLKAFVIGYDHQFGRNREGSKATIINLGKTLGFETKVVEAHDIGEVTVSSTSVRKALEQQGNTTLAREFLGRPYRLRAMVVAGDGRGRKIGFPTANLRPENPKKIIPQEGVYAVEVFVDDQRYKGMMNIGTRPTFHTRDSERTLEVNIFDFDRRIYGKTIEVGFLKRIRGEKAFDSADALVAQLQSDKAIALQAE